MPEGIVLARIPFREHDETISFITRESGRVDVRGRGIRKITSKLSPHVEPFSSVFFEYAEGKETLILTSVAVMDAFPAIRQDFFKSLHAGYVARTLYTLTRQGNLESGIFDLFSSWLQTIEHVDKIQDSRFIDWFMLKLMNHLGLGPRYHVCVECGRSDALEKWSFSRGGVVCLSCATQVEDASRSLFLISTHILSEISRLDQAFVHELLRMHDFVPAIHRLLVGHVEYHLETPVGNWAHTYQ